MNAFSFAFNLCLYIDFNEKSHVNSTHRHESLNYLLLVWCEHVTNTVPNMP